MKYEWVLFDADDTLFHFDAFLGLQMMFASFDVDFNESHYKDYQLLNQALWVQYQNGQINAQQIQLQRFTVWGERLNCSPFDLNSAYMAAMAEICKPLEGATALLETLRAQEIKLGIITNGFIELQEIRLARTGLREYFDVLIISEEVGVAKPDPRIFDSALEKMNHPSRTKVLMVGDNPDSDILGGMNAGLDTCWLNTHQRALPEGILPTYQISDLNQLQRLLTD